MTNPSQKQAAILITPGKADNLYWFDIWRHRELFIFLTWRDLIVRYKQTIMGISWTILRPLITMLVFTIVFSLLAGLPSDGVPYSLMVLAGLLPWTFFTSAFNGAAESMYANAGMVSKIYFPRLIFPASAVMVALIDFFISFSLMVALLIWYGVQPHLRILILPLLVGLVFALSLGAGVFAAALNVKYRDIRYIIRFVLQTMLYLSPIGYSSAIVSQKWYLLFALNPMVGIINAFRWAILPINQAFDWIGLLYSIFVSIILLYLGIRYFRSVERSFVDVI